MNVVVIGGGAAGVELAFGVAVRLARRFGCQPNVTIVERSERVLAREDAALSDLVTRRLHEECIDLALGVGVVNVVDSEDEVQRHVELSDGRSLPFDLLLYATGAAAHPLFANSDVEETADGFMCVEDTLQSVSHPYVFGAGDCVRMVSQPAYFPPKAGAYAVRMGPTLIANLHACLQHAVLRLPESEKEEEARRSGSEHSHSRSHSRSRNWPLPLTLPAKYEPQSGFLALLMTGDGRAVGGKFGIAFEGAWVWELKKWIDEAWMRLFSRDALAANEQMGDFEPASAPVAEPTAEEAAEALALEGPEATDFAVQLAALRKMARDNVYCAMVVAMVKERQDVAGKLEAE